MKMYNPQTKIHVEGGGLALLGAIVLGVGAIFIQPWLSFQLAYFSGWLAKIVIGDWLVKGFALIGLDIVKDSIPLLAGVLGFIGGFFKPNVVKTTQN